MINLLWPRMLFRNSDWLEGEIATCSYLCIVKLNVIMTMPGSELSLLCLPCFDVQSDYCMGTK